MGVAVIRCDCGTEQKVYTGIPRQYVLSSGETIPAASRLVWCRDCGRYTSAEDLPAAAEVEEEMALVEAKDELYLSAMVQTPEAVVRECRRVLGWLKERQSPPRCFECGSTAISPPDLEGVEPERVDHPACGGKAEVSYGLALLRMYPVKYSPEGERLDGGE